LVVVHWLDLEVRSRFSSLEIVSLILWLPARSSMSPISQYSSSTIA
jgi:hypothetical protein